MTEGYYTTEEMNDIAQPQLKMLRGMANLWSARITICSGLCFYNKTMFDEAGIQPPVKLDKAWTWEEATARSFKKNDKRCRSRWEAY